MIRKARTLAGILGLRIRATAQNQAIQAVAQDNRVPVEAAEITILIAFRPGPPITKDGVHHVNEIVSMAQEGMANIRPKAMASDLNQKPLKKSQARLNVAKLAGTDRCHQALYHLSDEVKEVEREKEEDRLRLFPPLLIDEDEGEGEVEVEGGDLCRRHIIRPPGRRG
jgi:hypothetical protein